LHAELVYRDELLAKENESLKASVAKFQDSEPTKRIDPATIRASKWANRSEDSFKGPAWDEFKKEILNAGGNIQPIKVRGVPPGNTLQISHEIVFGHRRHRACLELGLPVFTLIEDATDRELFEQMDRENRQRADLTIYEQGEMYRRALDDGLYSSLRKLSDSIGVGLGIASESVKIARLPSQVLDAFESRLDIQRRWAGPLADAVQKDPDATLAIANAIKAERDSGVVVKSAEVFKRITTMGDVSNITHSIEVAEVTGKSGCKAQISFNQKRKIFSISIEGLEESKLKTIEKMLKEL
jgi:ParB family chromosome partitioning protein